MSQRFTIRSSRFFLFLAIALVAIWAGSQTNSAGVFGQAVNSTGNQESPILELNQPIERELAGGQSHFYRLKLEAGQYVKIEAFQYWISVELRLFDPAGKLVLAVKLRQEDAQTEMLSAIADQSGDFKLEVTSDSPKPVRSSYTITLVRRQAATAQDRMLVEADRLQVEAFALTRQGKKAEAVQLSQKAVALYEQAHGKTSVELDEPLKLLAAVEAINNNYPAVEGLHKRILAIREQAFGRDHLDVAESLFELAALEERRSNDAQAKAWREEILRIREKLLQPDDLRIAQAANSLGNSYRMLNQFAPAETMLRRALTMQERLLGAEHRTTIKSSTDLAGLLATIGQYGKAETLYARAAEVLGRIDPDSAQTAAVLLNLGRVNFDLGNFARSEPFVQRALAQFERLFGPEHANVAAALALRGRLYVQQKRHDLAEQAYRRALVIREKLFGPENSLTSQALNGLATALMSQEKLEEAEKLYLRSIQITEKKLGLGSWQVAVDAGLLGMTYQKQRKLAEAEKQFSRAAAIYEKSLGPNHPFTYEARLWLMNLYRLQGRVEDALREQAHVLELSEFNLAVNLFAGDDAQKLGYVDRFDRDIADRLSLHIQMAPDSPQALQQAMHVLLLRKGRALDEMGQALSALRRRTSGANGQLFDQLADKLKQRSELATKLGAAAPNRESAMQQLNEEIRKLQASLSERSREFRAQTQPITVEAVRTALPANAALVEFARFRSYDEQSTVSYEEQYAAYILLPDGTLRWALLGKAEEIDRLIEAWRKALDPQKNSATPSPPAEANKLARQLDALVMQPVRARLGSIRQVFLVPDGDLNLIPFAALRDERGRYLIEDYLFVYLTSGRDLLRLKVKHESQPDQLIFAVSDFDGQAVASASTAAKSSPGASDTRGGLLSADATMATIRFDRLAFARAEGEAVRRVFPQAKLFADGQAQETALKQVHRPYFLHLVTHGFFLPDTGQKSENPLLRSGLAFTGANARRSGDDDGLLTAFEAAALDLWGTKLVVLSACETGVGAVKNGEGVFGLRRALVLAGAETQVVSLWRADDLVTQKLMQDFYQRLNTGLGRAEALRQAQLKMLRGGVNPRPYYWANFVCIGDWQPLNPPQENATSR